MNHELLYGLIIEPTTHCNVKCSQCARFNNHFGDGSTTLHPDLTLDHLSIDVLKNSIDFSKFPNLTFVKFEGDKGDPLMHPQLLEFVALFSKLKLVWITTNGSIGNERIWAELAKFKNLRVTFSIDGLSDTNHLYRVSANYNKIVKNAASFIANGGIAEWKCIVWRHNQHQIKEIISTARNLNFCKLTFVRPDPSRFNGNNKWPVTDTLNNIYYLEYPEEFPAITEYELSSNTFIPKHVRDLNENYKCAWNKMGIKYINHLGHALPCCMMHFDSELQYHGTDHLKQLCGGFDNISLSNFMLHEILDGIFYNVNLEKSLESTNTAHFNCQRSCGHIFKNDAAT